MNTDKFIIAAIVVIVLYAHWWIFQWVKFKVDEAVVHKQLSIASNSDHPTVAKVAAKTGISEHRVSKVCRRSKLAALKSLISS
jgi:hypothetical protein